MEMDRRAAIESHFERLTAEGVEQNLVFLSALADSGLGHIHFYQYLTGRNDLPCDLNEFKAIAEESIMRMATLQVNNPPVDIQFTLAVTHDGIEKQAEFRGSLNEKTVAALKAAYATAFGRELTAS